MKKKVMEGEEREKGSMEVRTDTQKVERYRRGESGERGERGRGEESYKDILRWEEGTQSILKYSLVHRKFITKFSF